MIGNTTEREVFNGSSIKGKWSKALLVAEDESGKGTLGLSVSLVAGESFDTSRAGSIIVSAIQDTYFSLEEDPLTALENCIQQAQKALKEVLNREADEQIQKGVELDISLILYTDDYVYFAIFGNGLILLWRDNTIITISDGLKSREAYDIKVGSGHFKESDVFILATPQSTVQISEEEIVKSIDTFSFENLSKDSQSFAGCSVLLIRNQVEEEVPELAESETYSTKNDTHDDEREHEEGETPETTEVISKSPSFTDRSKDFFSTMKEKVQQLRESEDGSPVQNWLGAVKSAALAVFEWLKTNVWYGVLGFKEQDSIRLRGAKSQANWRGIIGLAIILLLVVYLLYSGIRGIAQMRSDNENTQRVEELLVEIDARITDADNLRKLDNENEARKHITEAEDLISSAQEFNTLTDEVAKREHELIRIKRLVNKIILIDDSAILTNLSAFVENAAPTDIEIIDNLLYVSDAENGKIYTVSLDGSEVNTIFTRDSGLSRPISITKNGIGNLVIYDEELGILEADLANSVIAQVSGLSSNTVSGTLDLEGFTSFDETMYIYYLNPDETAVKRSLFSNGVYGFPAVRYENAVFASGKDLEIDENFGKLYVLVNERQGIIRYADGVDNYEVFGIPEDNGAADFIGADSMAVTLEYLLIGDSSKDTIALVTKGNDSNPGIGNFMGQFTISQGFNAIKDIVVDEETNDLYVLDTTQILKIDLSLLSTLTQ